MIASVVAVAALMVRAGYMLPHRAELVIGVVVARCRPQLLAYAAR